MQTRNPGKLTLLVVGFLVGVGGIVAPEARAQDRAAGRQAFIEGSKYYDLSQYAEALTAFKRAYWNNEDPVFLYNIAQCHRALKHNAEAIDFYRSYLRKAPTARNRAEVTHLVAELEAAIANERNVSTLSPQGMIGAGATADSTPPPPPDQPPPTVAIPTPVATPTITTTRPEAPHKHRPAWVIPVAVVGAVVVVGLGVGLGIGLTSGTTYPHTSGTVVWK